MQPEDLQLIGMVMEAVRRGEDGEILVRRGEDAGRIQISGGKVAFVDASGAERDVAAVVAGHTGLDEAELGEIFEDCLLEGRDFGGHLLAEGRAEREALRAGLLDFFSASLLRLLSWVAPTCRFEPGEHPATAKLAFGFEQVLQAAIDRDVEGALPHSAMNAADVLDLAEKVSMPLPGEPLDAPQAPAQPVARPVPASFEPEREVTVKERLPAGMLETPDEKDEPREAGPNVDTVRDGTPLGAGPPPGDEPPVTPDPWKGDAGRDLDLPPPPVAGTGVGETVLRGEPLRQEKKNRNLILWFAIAFVVGIVATLLIYGLVKDEGRPAAPGSPQPLVADAGAGATGGSTRPGDETGGSGEPGEPTSTAGQPGEDDQVVSAQGRAGTTGQPGEAGEGPVTANGAEAAGGQTGEAGKAAGTDAGIGDAERPAGQAGSEAGGSGGAVQPIDLSGGAEGTAGQAGAAGETGAAGPSQGAADEAGTAGEDVAGGAGEQPARLEMTGIVAGGPGEGAGAVRVLSRPRRARIFLDGIDTGKHTPALLRGVPAGVEHVILLARRGRRPAVRKLTAHRGKTARVKLALRRGRLPGAWRERVQVKVFSRPEGAAILVDGKPSGRRTPAKIALRADRAQKLTLELEGHDKWERTVRAWPRGDLSVLATLDEAERP